MSTAGGFAGAWRHRRWRWMLASFTVSLTGDFLYMVALVVFVLEATDSAAWVAGAAVARVMAYVVLGPIGGVLADRMDRRRLMLTLDLVRFAIMAALALLVWADGPPAIVVLGTVAAAAASTPYRPAAVAATPVLVAEDDLAAANAAESIVGSLAFFAGPALGAAVVTIANPGAAFAVNAATYLVSAAFITRIGDAGGGPPPTPTPSSGETNQTNDSGDVDRDDAMAAAQEPSTGGIVAAMWTDIREGAGVMRNNAAVAALTVLAGAVVFQYGAEAVLLPFVATDRLGLDLAGVGLLLAAQGVGGIIAAPFMGRLGARRNAGQLLAGSGVVAGVTMALLAVTSSTWVAITLFAVEGVSTIVFEVLLITMLQRACPEGVLARVYGLQDSLTAATQLIGSALAPLALLWFGLEGGLVFFGIAVGAISIATAPALARASAASDEERRALAPLTERFGALGIFGDASQAALERIARATSPLHVAAGEIVFVEGDKPDDLYVVDAGTFDVTTQAHGLINKMGPDDWFGEIGLLRGLPRTATVTATSPSNLLEIPGQIFLDALASPDVLPDPLRRTMSRRLVRTHPWLDDPEPDAEAITA